MDFSSVPTRLAVPNDIPAIFAMTKAAMIDDGDYVDDGQVSGFVATFFYNGVWLFVCEHKGEVVGYITFKQEGLNVVIGNLYTLPTAPCGAGYALLTAYKGYINLNNVNDIVLTRPYGGRTIKAYGRMGFKPEAVIYRTDVGSFEKWSSK